MADTSKMKPEDEDACDGAPKDELELLLEGFCLGELDDAGWQRLNEVIAGDRDAARRYAEAAHFCQTLRDETVGQGRSLPPFPAIEHSTGDRGTGNRNAGNRNSGDGASLSSPTLGEGSSARSSSSRAEVPWYLQLGMAVGLAFVCGWFFAHKTPGETSGTPRGAVDTGLLLALEEPGAVAETVETALAATPSDKRVRLGRVTGLTAVASSDGLLRSMRVGTLLGRGEVFQITRGSARLEISGNEVLVEGPAELSAIDTRTVFVRHGRVTVPEACGLAVQTPVASFSLQDSSHGSFAVVADRDSSAVVSALDGAVTVKSSRSRGVVSPPHRVDAGETVEVSRAPDRSIEVAAGAARPEGLLLSWDETDERLHPYERLVLADAPMAYWPLYRVRRHRAVLDLTQNGFDGQAIGNWPTALSDVHASQLRGAYFDGESYVETDHKPPVDLRTGFTIESWAKVAGGPEYQAVFTSRWVLSSNSDQQQCFGCTLYAGADDRWQFWNGSGEYGANWQVLSGPTEVQRNRWTHVAASFEPDADQEDGSLSIHGAVRLYVDGVEVARSEHTVSLEDFEWPARIGAAEFVPRSLTSWLFKGELRDVALYDHVLDVKKIQHHATAGRTAI